MIELPIVQGGPPKPTTPTPQIIVIPSSDRAFGEHVRWVLGRSPRGRAEFEARLRRLYPRTVIRERALAGEPQTWYVYRDGRWRPSGTEDWWSATGVPRFVASPDGWIREANSTAGGILGIDVGESQTYHFTDFIVPGTLEDWLALFAIVEAGAVLDSTILLRPVSGDLVAVDIHLVREDVGVVGRFRLSEDVEVPIGLPTAPRPIAVACSPRTDVAFKGYVDQAVQRMPQPTPEGLALRLRRLYPHARVTVDGEQWVAARDGDEERAGMEWWTDDTLPRVTYDGMAMIVDANDAARALLGRELVGHHWQEFVTPGSTEQVTVMLEILAEVGAAESRFRMPRADGTLLEFDSYTVVQEDTYTTIMRPVDVVVRPRQG